MQILIVLKFIRNFIDENPLCCCSEEISEVKQAVAREGDDIKLRQKSSSLSICAAEGPYSGKYIIGVPEDYPDTRVRWVALMLSVPLTKNNIALTIEWCRKIADSSVYTPTIEVYNELLANILSTQFLCRLMFLLLKHHYQFLYLTCLHKDLYYALYSRCKCWEFAM